MPLWTDTPPADSAPFTGPSILAAIRSHDAIHPVANATARATHLATLAAAGINPSNAKPVMVWRIDLQRIEVTTNGTSWLTFAPVGDTGWTFSGAVYGNSFTGYSGGGWAGIAYRYVSGMVTIAGAFQRAFAWDGSEPVCNIPVPYRPARTVAGQGCRVNASGDLYPTAGSGAGDVSITYPVGSV